VTITLPNVELWLTSLLTTQWICRAFGSICLPATLILSITYYVIDRISTSDKIYVKRIWNNNFSMKIIILKYCVIFVPLHSLLVQPAPPAGLTVELCRQQVGRVERQSCGLRFPHWYHWSERQKLCLWLQYWWTDRNLDILINMFSYL